jgi:hypothetical protein
MNQRAKDEILRAVNELIADKMKKNYSMPLKEYAREQCFSESQNNFT